MCWVPKLQVGRLASGPEQEALQPLFQPAPTKGTNTLDNHRYVKFSDDSPQREPLHIIISFNLLA